MTPVKEKKQTKKVLEITRFNPSQRKYFTIELEELQVGVLRYKEDNFECLIGIETENEEERLNFRGLNTTMKHPRRISRIRWSVHSSGTIGDAVSLSPRDIGILDAIIKYLKKQGYYIP